jgi:hypothetical protein
MQVYPPTRHGMERDNCTFNFTIYLRYLIQILLVIIQVQELFIFNLILTQ